MNITLTFVLGYLHVGNRYESWLTTMAGLEGHRAERACTGYVVCTWCLRLNNMIPHVATEFFLNYHLSNVASMKLNGTRWSVTSSLSNCKCHLSL